MCDATQLFIGPIPGDVDESVLRPHLAPFGNAYYIRVHRDKTGASKCCAFVNYERASSARAAIEALNGTLFIAGSTRSIGVRWADVKPATAAGDAGGAAADAAATAETARVPPSLNTAGTRVRSDAAMAAPSVGGGAAAAAHAPRGREASAMTARDVVDAVVAQLEGAGPAGVQLGVLGNSLPPRGRGIPSLKQLLERDTRIILLDTPGKDPCAALRSARVVRSDAATAAPFVCGASSGGRARAMTARDVVDGVVARLERAGPLGMQMGVLGYGLPPRLRGAPPLKQMLERDPRIVLRETPGKDPWAVLRSRAPLCDGCGVAYVPVRSLPPVLCCGDALVVSGTTIRHVPGLLEGPTAAGSSWVALAAVRALVCRGAMVFGGIRCCEHG